MRYLVRYWDGKNIINDLATNDCDAAYEREKELRAIYGRENVWTADAVVEIMVG